MSKKKIKAQIPLEIPKELSVNHKFLTGQVSLELATAFVCILMLLLASVKLSVWVVGQMVTREQGYRDTRITGGNAGDPVNEPTNKPLDFFK